MLLNSAGNTEARPTNISQSYNSKDNDTAEWLGELENPNSGGQDSGNEVEKSIVIQLYTTEDKDTIEWLEQLENSKPDLQEGGVQEKTLAVGVAGKNEAQTSQHLGNARKARNASNACIERYQYRFIYNYFFRIPVCKQGCKRKLKTVTFSNGKTLAIVYDCY